MIGERAERDAWAVLGSVSGIGPATLVAAVARAGGAAALLRLARVRDRAALAVALAPPSDGRRSGPATVELVDLVIAAAGAADRTLSALAADGIVPLIPGDPAYPRRLLATEAPPAVLFVRGDVRALSAPRAVAIVGTRRPTEAGRRLAGRFAGAISRTGAVVISGLAVGIDGAAHAAAIAEGAPTVAVLGGGHRRLFPQAHARLADLVVDEGGAVIAEVGPEVEPSRWSFPRRNRIVSGLAEATVVVEAAARSGALITAGHALEQGRECFLVPGSIESPASAGCLAFLRSFPGVARIVAGVDELLEDLRLVDPDAVASSSGSLHPVGAPGPPGPLGRVESAVAAALARGATTLDELADAVGEPVATLLGALTLLEMRGLVVEANGGYRPLGRLASRGFR